MRVNNFPDNLNTANKWAELRDYYRSGKPVVGEITKYSDYFGYTVSINGILADMNKNELTSAYVDDYNEWCGRKVLVKLVRVDEYSKKIVVSRKRLAYSYLQGQLVHGFVTEIVGNRMHVDVGFLARVHIKDMADRFISDINDVYSEGQAIDLVLNENYSKEKYTEASTRPSVLWNVKKKGLTVHDILSVFIDEIKDDGVTFSLTDYIQGFVHKDFLSENFRNLFDKGRVEVGSPIEVAVTKINDEKRRIYFSMKEASKIKERNAIEALKSQLERGHIVEVEVIDVNEKDATLNIIGTDVNYKMSRDELSPNKVIKASDEVFIGQIFPVVYLGENNGNLSFSRKYFVEDVYDESLYDLSLSQLLDTMSIKTTRFVGKAIKMKENLFFCNIMSVAEIGTDDNGKLLVDPITGKNLIAVINESVSEIKENKYYEFEIDLAFKNYRKKRGTPYMFCVNGSCINEVSDPYKEAISLAFTKQRTPSQSTSLAYLLNEVGQGLYSKKERMFFELIQNADDSASQCGVQIKLQVIDNYFVLSHNGYSFSKHDFDSIISAAKSTKGSNKKKTGYKGIGFKSVFTNSDTVQIKSGGFNFLFDKSLEIYNDFKKFYFYVNDIENSSAEQKKFLHTFEKEYREFRDVRDIPWQLLPIWTNKESLETPSIFNENENVSIALKMADENLSQYEAAIEEIFREPRFMLFLRNTKRVQLIQNGTCKTIQKTISKQNNVISLANSYNEGSRVENYKIFSSGEILVDDNAFMQAGIPIRRTERQNSRGGKDIFLVNLDENGNLLKTTIDVPDRIASSTETNISIALRVDDKGLIIPIAKDDLSLYAYLPMNENRYKFPFYINADFVPKSDREGLNTDNPWNHFLFYQIGINLVRMVSNIATHSQPQYLNLLLKKEMTSDTVDTELLTDAFNRGYKEGLSTYNYIIDDEGNKANANKIIIDKSGLADLVGNSNFYTLIGTDKRLPNPDIDTTILANELFNIECIKATDVVDILTNDIDKVNAWLDSTNEESRNNFYEWVAANKDCSDLVADIHTFCYNSCWYSINDISFDNKQIVTTKTYLPILPILAELGFMCSENVFDDHPLENVLEDSVQTDKDLFEEIQKQDISALSFEKRLLLFKTASQFTGIADASLKSWSLFKNIDGECTSLNNLLPFDASLPKWLNKYILCEEETCDDLKKYLVNPDEAYSSIIVPNIGSLIESTDVYVIYTQFHTEWSPSLTSSLIISKTSNIISVVEQSGVAVKLDYLKNIGNINIDSERDYSQSDDTYKTISLALSDDSLIATARTKITIDNLPLSEFIIKDEFSMQVGLSTFTFYLSSLIPDYESTSKLNKVISHFKSLPSIEKLFELREITNYTWVKKNLLSHLATNNSPLLSQEQFAFFICYEKKLNKSYFEIDIKPYIKINDKDLFLKILDYCYNNGMGEILRSYITISGIEYPFDRIYGTYFDCGMFALPTEQTPEYISKWAETKEKKDFLITLGLHDLASDEMVRRQAFYNGEEKGNWTITTKAIIENLLAWIKSSMTLPFADDYHRNILMPLMSKIGCSKTYDEQDVYTAEEWGDDRYKDWKSEKQLRIFIYGDKIPYSCSWNDSVFYTGAEEDFKYFPETSHLYINGSVEAASVLSNVFPVRGIPFEKDDWHQLFFVSRDSITQYSAENESLRNKIAELEEQLNLFRAAEHSGKEASERGNVASSDQEAINREARIMAKSMLKRHGYDVSDWDPVTSLPDVVSIIKTPEGEPINVVIRSAKGRKIHLAATSFEALMSNPNNLLVVRGEDGEIHTVDFQELFGGNSNVNLIFDANFTPLSYFKALGTIFKYVKNTDFVIENPQYSAFDEIKNFGLDVKNEGEIIIGTEEDI